MKKEIKNIDMTTEERALHLAKEFGATKANKESTIYRACIRMAEEQRKIDADKACEWLKNVEHYELAEGGMLVDELIKDFRKAMGE